MIKVRGFAEAVITCYNREDAEKVVYAMGMIRYWQDINAYSSVKNSMTVSIETKSLKHF